MAALGINLYFTNLLLFLRCKAVILSVFVYLKYFADLSAFNAERTANLEASSSLNQRVQCNVMKWLKPLSSLSTNRIIWKDGIYPTFFGKGNVMIPYETPTIP